MKTCPVCGDPIKGRMDKVYCTPKCKNAAHYEDRLLKEDFFVFVDFDEVYVYVDVFFIVIVIVECFNFFLFITFL